MNQQNDPPAFQPNERGQYLQLPLSHPPKPVLDLVLELAREAFFAGEVPVGSVIAHVDFDDSGKEKWRTIAAERNRIIEKKDPTAHSEILAIQKASGVLQSERLTECRMITSLEPCLMCSGGIVLSRMEAVYYFAPGIKGMFLEEIMDHSRNGKHLNHYPQIIQIQNREKEAADLLKRFFLEKRSRPGGFD